MMHVQKNYFSSKNLKTCFLDFFIHGMGPLDAAGINNASAEADADANGQFRIFQRHW